MQFPSTIGGVVPVVNLPGIEPGKLRFTGPLLADIFLGKVTTWNDPAIAALNPGVALPDRKINVVHRSDGSGTTFNFVNYLSKVSPEWKTKVGEGTSVNWPARRRRQGQRRRGRLRQADQGRDRLRRTVLRAAEQDGATRRCRTRRQLGCSRTRASFAAAAASADWTNAKDFNLVITNAPGADAWPITATNFILMHKQPKDAARMRKAALEFFRWAYANGSAQAQSLHYVPLPAELVQQIEAYWAASCK